MDKNDLSRRDILAGLGWILTGTSGLYAAEVVAEPLHQEAPATPVTVAVIGLGERGREILTSLGYVSGSVVKYVCDTYEGTHKRAIDLAKGAKGVTDYKQVLSDSAVQGVFIATPTHLHKQITLDAIAAGKAVYCEAPLAHTIEEAKVIALAGKNAKTIFQSGLQNRPNAQHAHVLKFIRTGVLGANMGRVSAQWNKKTSWRRAAPSDDRQRDLNWRLDSAISPGLMGEIGIHQVDTASWFLKSPPTSVVGFGSVRQWKDGRSVPDTVQAIFEYPSGVRLTYDATLSNSFGGTFELFQGSDSTILLRGARAWMFKEADAVALGWEVYARKDSVGDDNGIMLVANASKLIALGKQPGDFAIPDPKETPLFYACSAFLDAIRTGSGDKNSAENGYVATVVALKANEAIQTGNKISIPKELVTLT
jgi:predicted dehydrogenase